MGFPSLEELSGWIGLSDAEAVRALHARAYAEKTAVIGRRVSMRGLIEAGNVCAKDCRYCGIRASNRNLTRYQLTQEEIVAGARFAAESGYGSVVIQSGEIESEAHTRFIEEVLRAIAPLKLGVTLSLGEQTEEVYRRWRDAGATRYLLRIETSNPALYAALHPANCSFERRVECLRALRRCGYQVGTGVMAGLPGQTLELTGARFTFNAPVDYPGIRVKHVSTLVNALLVAAFTLMIVGLYITFFYEPVLVKVDDTGYTVAGPKPERMRVELGEELREYEQCGI